MSWHQSYDVVGGSVVASALTAAIPVVLLLTLLARFHMAAHKAALFSLAAAALVAVLAFEMPAKLAAAAAAYGAAFGLFPIGWIVLNAIFLYEISVASGQFQVLKRAVAGLAADRRLQLLLVAFSFGALIEGAAGFGTPVAISGAMLIGLGWRPLDAAVLALIGNTAPVAFGSLGTPILALNAVTGLPLGDLAAMVGRQLPVFSLIIPFWLVAVMAGLRGLKDVWPACLAAGLSFGLVQFLVSNYHGPWLVDILAALASMTALVVVSRVWKPKTTWRFGHEEVAPADARAPTVAETARALSPWLLLTGLVFLWGVPAVKRSLDLLAVKVPVPLLHKAVWRVPPVVAHPEPEAAVFTFNWLSAAGTALFLAAVIAGLSLRFPPRRLARMYLTALIRVRLSLLTISVMMALAFVTRYSGSDTAMGLAFARTGLMFPLFSALLGWLGVALTGSDTSSNVLFGNLQKVTAEQLGLPPVLTAATNASGGVMGKMIDAQSIVVASVATGGEGSASAGEILRRVFWHSLALALSVGLLTLAQAYLVPWMVP